MSKNKIVIKSAAQESTVVEVKSKVSRCGTRFRAIGDGLAVAIVSVFVAAFVSALFVLSLN